MAHLGYPRAMGPHPRPWDGMADEELYELAKRTLTAAAELPPGSVERAMKFAAYDSVVNEAKRRAVRQAMRTINEQLGLPDIDL